MPKLLSTDVPLLSKDGPKICQGITWSWGGGAFYKGALGCEWGRGGILQVST